MQLPLAIDKCEHAFEFALLGFETAMLLGADLNTVTVEHDLAHWGVFHYPALLWKKPCFVSVGEARIGRLHHDINLAAVRIECSGQLMLVALQRRVRARLCKAVYPARIRCKLRGNGKRERELGCARDTDFIAHLPIDLGREIK